MKIIIKILCACLLLVFFVFLLFRYTGRKCYIVLPNKTLIIEMSRPTTNGWADGYYSEVKIYSALNKYSPFPKKIYQDKVGGGMIENADCQCFQFYKNQLLILGKFYSPDAGISFINIEDFKKPIQDKFNENDLKISYPEIRNDSLMIRYNTFNNYEITKVFYSFDGGLTWLKK